jgi:acetyl esterase
MTARSTVVVFISWRIARPPLAWDYACVDATSPTVVQRGQAYAGRALSALPLRLQRLLAGGEVVRIDGQELDAGVQLLLRVRTLLGQPSVISGPEAEPNAERAVFHGDAVAFARWQTAVEAVTEVAVDGGAGPLHARHYRPAETGGPQPLLVFVHGGGWVTGDLDTHDEPCRLLCRHAGVHVLSIDYRLAPEHPFPAAVEDVLAAWRWAHEHAEKLGADPNRIAVGGDSAGGNLSAVAAQQLAQADWPAPALQVLIYPAVDLAERRRSSELFGDGFLLTNGDRDWCESKYIGGTGADRTDPKMSPLRAPDLAGLPPAIIVTAAFDPLRDEGEAYASALHEAGNQVTLYRAPGLVHGFINLTSVNRASRDATLALAGMVRAGLSAGAPVSATTATSA